VISIVAIGVIGWLSVRYFKLSPISLGLGSDGKGVPSPIAKPKPRLSRSEIVRIPGFITLSTAFALGLFAQIGLVSHLIARLTPDVGEASAGLLLSLSTICAVIGRTLTGWWIGDHDRRIAAAINFVVQTVGVLLLILGNGWVVLALGCIVFGLGMGNLTSLPPLIAQKEFSREDVVAVVALIVAINQGVFAFAPAIVGAFRDATSGYGLPFGIVACLQFVAAVLVLIGRKTGVSLRL
jgi:predicted MFS family arabinose efflux permease